MNANVMDDGMDQDQDPISCLSPGSMDAQRVATEAEMEEKLELEQDRKRRWGAM